MAMQFIDLPSEIVTSILGHIYTGTDLLQCTLVNKLFYSMVIPRLWREPFKYGAKSQHLLNSIAMAHQQRSYGDYIKNLYLDEIHDSIDTVLALLKQTPKLNELLLIDRYNTMPPCLNTIWFSCSQLTIVHMFHVRITDLSGLAHHCTRLERFTIRSTHADNPHVLQPLINCHHLTSIELFEYHWNTAPDMNSLVQLEHLHLDQCRQVDNAFILQLSLVRLTTVSFKGTRPLDPNIIAQFLGSNPRLQSITLELTHINDSFLSALAALPNSHHLDIKNIGPDGFSYESMRLLANKCCWLTSLIVRGVYWDRRFPNAWRQHGYLVLKRGDLERLQQNIHFTTEDDWSK
ncbi:hypothetical protein BC941DRAFT_441130 [Chlamydoabsidia padenii]|nr:hypothetical protein BC941DRAFT_441130 [Chlamydoabsidia padenii]